MLRLAAFQLRFADSLRPLANCGAYHIGHWRHADDESVLWPRLVAVLSGLEEVDELLESVMWMWEEARLLLPEDRDAELDRRLREFRQLKATWSGDRHSQLMSLAMRGVSLRCPPVPSPAAAAPPAVLLPATTASRDSSSSSSGSSTGSQSSLPLSPPPPYSSSDSSSLPTRRRSRQCQTSGSQAALRC